MKQVFLVSYEGMPVDEDSAVLIQALNNRGIEGKSVNWDDPTIDWTKPDLCIIKSASNYILDPTKFQNWAKKVEKTNPLWNTRKLIQWNQDKHYLKDLEKKGIPIPPSIFVSKSSSEDPRDILQSSNWDEIVIKPTIACGSFGLQRFKSDSVEAERYLVKLTKAGYIQEILGETHSMPPCDAIIQPYLPEIMNGEVSVFYYGNQYSHAVLKKASQNDFRAHPIWGASVERHTPSIAEYDVCDAIFDAIGMTEYVRIDLVNTSNGPLIIEVELIEPFMFFDVHPEAADTFADYIKMRLTAIR